MNMRETADGVWERKMEERKEMTESVMAGVSERRKP